MGHQIVLNTIALRVSAQKHGRTCLTLDSTPDTALVVTQPAAVIIKSFALLRSRGWGRAGQSWR